MDLYSVNAMPRVPDAVLNQPLVQHIIPQSTQTDSAAKPSADSKPTGGKATLRDSFTFSVKDIDLSHVTDLTGGVFGDNSGIIYMLEHGTTIDHRNNEGRTLVDNPEPSLTLIPRDMTTIGMRTADDARWSAKQGGATHAFLYQTAECLTDAAKLYSKLGDNEDYRTRAIHDGYFVTDTLDFFTGGTYTSSDKIAMQQSIDTIVFELADQVKQGKEPDISQVKSKLNVAGTEISLSELFQYQKVGRALEDAIDHAGAGNSITAEPAKKGVAVSYARYYGSTRGEFGSKFSDAIQRLYEKNRDTVRNLASRPVYAPNGQQLTTVKAATETGIQIADLLSKLNTSSKSAFQQDFQSKLSDVNRLTAANSSAAGIPCCQEGLDASAALTMRYFQMLLKNFG